MSSRGACVSLWIDDASSAQGERPAQQTPVTCAQYQTVLESLLVLALSDPDSLSSTDRNIILSAIRTPSVLVKATRFLLHESGAATHV